MVHKIQKMLQNSRWVDYNYSGGLLLPKLTFYGFQQNSYGFLFHRIEDIEDWIDLPIIEDLKLIFGFPSSLSFILCEDKLMVKINPCENAAVNWFYREHSIKIFV